MPDDCARTVISLEANALLSHEVVNTPPPRGCFRISTVLWLYPTEPIARDYTPLRTANMSPEEVAAYRADAPARWAVGAARRSAAAKKASAAAYGADAYGADPTALRSAAAKKGKDKMGPDRRSAIRALRDSRQLYTSTGWPRDTMKRGMRGSKKNERSPTRPTPLLYKRI